MGFTALLRFVSGDEEAYFLRLNRMVFVFCIISDYMLPITLYY